MADISFILIGLAASFPTLMVLFGAAAIALFKMTHDPHRRAKVLGAIGILLFIRFVSPFATGLVLNFAGIEVIEVRILLNGLMWHVPRSLAYALLFWAIFDGRPSRRREQLAGE